jgi:general L-amino acid transport system substrate-binding protein
MVGTALGVVLSAGAASAQVLDEIRNRGELRCGANTGLVGFAAPDEQGQWTGFDVDYCRALAAAVLGDPQAVEFIPTTGVTRFEALSSGEVDVLARNTTWTFTRDVDLNFTFTGVNYYDGQGFMVPSRPRRRLGDGTRRRHGLHPDRHHHRAQPRRLLPRERHGVRAGADRDQCRGPAPVSSPAPATPTPLTSPALRRMRATFDDPQAHVILPEVISKEPLGPLVRHGDDAWADINRWVLFALMAAEEKDVTQENVRELAESGDTGSPDINRMLGLEGEFGAMFGLESDWAVQAIEAVGNYGEIFERHLAPLGLERGMNGLWTDGGLHYPMPFR